MDDVILLTQLEGRIDTALIGIDGSLQGADGIIDLVLCGRRLEHGACFTDRLLQDGTHLGSILPLGGALLGGGKQLFSIADGGLETVGHKFGTLLHLTKEETVEAGLVDPSEVGNQVRLSLGRRKHDKRLHPGVTGEVQCGDLRSCSGLRRSRVDATVLQIVTHARRGPVCPDGEDIGLAGRECPTALQRLVRAAAGTAQTVKVGSAVSSSACHNLEVIL